MGFWGFGEGLAAVLAFWGLAYFRAPILAWSLALLGGVIALEWLTTIPFIISIFLWLFILSFIIIFNNDRLRERFFSSYLFHWFQAKLPPISATEREAIDAGDIAFEAELFQGSPQWKNLFSLPKSKLSDEELEFLETKVSKLCEMINDWEVTHQNLDLPTEVWDYLKKEKFFGLIIPKEYGGLGFSALANSTIVQKIATRSLSAAVTAMVPNSLGPGELLLNYGTKSQKDYYLPRLASGEEIPCFALTGPEAGSDATSIPDLAVVCRGKFEGKEILGLSLTWDKRYITLAPVATLLGLAVNMVDPEGLLGSKKHVGITLCLLPSQMAGIEIGKRHFPLNQSFLNGPTRGKNIFVPFDFIIGGPEKAGKGWHMLVERLSAGRGISLPALSTALAKHCYRTTGAYARIRKQFHTSIGRFQGVEAAMARMAGYTYMLEATRLLTLTFLDQKLSPGVATSISKYHMTSLSRSIINDAMDIQGGRGIMLGPNNYLARGYQSVPISITVEGANILTRSLMIFGQGAIRCHPYLRAEMKALNQTNQAEALKAFDEILGQHISYSLSNFVALVFHSLTAGLFAASFPIKALEAKIRQLSRMSLALAFVADIALLMMGGKLKRSERLSARLGDVLSYLYMASAVLKYYQDSGEQNSDLPFVQWSLQTCLYRIQNAFLRFFQNFKPRGFGIILSFLVFPFGRSYHRPNDRLDHLLAHSMMQPSEFRERLTRYCYQGNKETDAVANLELALLAMLDAEPILAKIEIAQKEGLLPRGLTVKGFEVENYIQAAIQKNVITEKEAETLLSFEKLRKKVIAVDEFSNEQLRGKG